MLVFSALPK